MTIERAPIPTLHKKPTLGSSYLARMNCIRYSALILLAACQTVSPPPVNPPTPPPASPKPAPKSNPKPITQATSPKPPTPPPASPKPTPHVPVCKINVPKNRPSVGNMDQHFPNIPAQEVFKLVGDYVERNGNLPKDQGRWENACAVRVSRALNYSGVRVPRIYKQTVTGGDGKQYFYRVRNLHEHITKIWGPPDLQFFARPDGEHSGFKKIGQNPSLVLMKLNNDPDAAGHSTIWNGKQTLDKFGFNGQVSAWHLRCD